MGLGKTIQTIAFLAWVRDSKTPKKYKTASQLKARRGNEMFSDDSDEETPKKVSPKKRGGKQNKAKQEIVIDDSSSDEEFGATHHSTAYYKSSESEDSAAEDEEEVYELNPNPPPPHLIVVPASVLDNWLNEFTKFCPSMVVVKYHGSQKERRYLQDRLLRTRKPKSPGQKRLKLDVVLTTFSYFSSERGDDRNFLRKNFDFDYMVVDEAHCLKNPKGARYVGPSLAVELVKTSEDVRNTRTHLTNSLHQQSISISINRYKNMIKFPINKRILLTGTPVQNSPKELMTLLCFLMPFFKEKKSKEGEEDDGGEKMLSHFVRVTQKKPRGGVKEYSTEKSA